MDTDSTHIAALRRPGLSWSAVIGGAFVTMALSLALIALGAGLELTALSPWTRSNGAALTAATIVWFIVLQIIANAMGGYLAGRLRETWSAIHNDEVYFRDTAHGFIVWAVAVSLTAAFMTTAATFMAGGTLQGATLGLAHDSKDGSSRGPDDYFVDQLYRPTGIESTAIQSDQKNASDAADNAIVSDGTSSPAKGLPSREERAIAKRILAHDLVNGGLTPADEQYLAQRVMANTNLSREEAQTRIRDTSNQIQQSLEDAKKATDTARKITVHTLLWTFVALLAGAFAASFAATFGGKQRDMASTRS